MNKISHIISREFLTRVKSKQFLISTFLGPIFMSLIIFVPVLISKNSDNKQQILVLDSSGIFENKLKNGNQIEFIFSQDDLELLKDSIKNDEETGLLVIPKDFDIQNPKEITYIGSNALSMQAMNYVESSFEKEITNLRLKKSGVNQSFLDSLKTKVTINTLKFSESGEQSSNTGAASAVGYIGSILMYIFIILFGTMVMRGVVEEKSNRIIEIIISSVKPFELMMGKIIGIACVGLLQFALWIGITTVLYSVGINFFDMQGAATTQQVSDVAANQPQLTGEIMNAISTLNLPYLIGMFFFYFIGGYLLYSALFAAIGSAVDSESDTQQLVFPVTVPLLIGFMVSQIVVQNPNSDMAFWFSIIPLFSPVVMMVRLPFDPPIWQVALSAGLLILGFIGTVWISARIYRVGILIYGKKPTFKEIYKWMFYKL